LSLALAALSGRAGRHAIWNSFHGGQLSDTNKILIGAVVWLATVTGAHLALNFNWQVLLNDQLPESERKLNVAYIPVT